ncbi:general substrate transporter [Halteromyces radiatus]|uniref:general substrate transporter n=1 Tax=Halteromyces radiatus TaxID=101107 RepID=UPI00222078F7|nr:general substrate transporter [Halteromyces radiatus]KAI8096978.1 general substrate transporter [Halteromyces radiatus]
MRNLSIIATIVSCLGGFLFGFDLGVISGILAMPSFTAYFHIAGDPNTVAQMKGNVVSLLQAGCCVGSLLTNLVADPVGRKKAIIIFSVIFILGGLLQTLAHNLDTMMAGRFVAGLGIGATSALVPMYIAEIAPKKLRGRLGTTWQFLIVLGIMVSYFVDYGCIRNLPYGDNQWRVPLGIQIVPGGLLLIGMIFLPESLRWLAVKGKPDLVKENLLRLRNIPEEDPEFVDELQEILTAAEEERTHKGKVWNEFFQKNMLHRLFIGVMVQVFQQWTGTNAINYYAPEIFQSTGMNTDNIDILATGVYGVVKVVFVALSFFMVDTKLGRRRTLMLGSLFMFTAFFILAGMIYGIQKDNGGNLKTAVVGAKGYVAVVMIYFFAIGYEFSWGPIPWVLCSEIFPTHTRAVSLSITTAFNWAMNAVIAKVTPIMMANITYGTYFFFGSMAVIMGIFTYFLVPETRGRSLEQIDEVFSGKMFVHNDSYVIDHAKLQLDAEQGNYRE